MKKLLISLLLLAFSPVTGIAQTDITIYSRTDHYSVDLENVKWYQKIAMVFLGLNWSEFSIKTTFEKNSLGQERVIEVTAWADNIETENPAVSDLAFRLSRSTDEAGSFLYFVKKTTFKEKEVAPLLDLYTYLYDDRDQEMRFDSDNIFEKNDGTMHSKFSKKRSAEGNEVSIRTFNSSGAENGWVEVNMRYSPEKHLQKISAKLKIGIIINLTKMVPEQEEN